MSTEFDPDLDDESPSLPEDDKPRRKRKATSASDDSTTDRFIPPPTPFPLDEALTEAFDPDPGNDTKSEILLQAETNQAEREQGRCSTTLTERHINPDCQCHTYQGNLGPCKSFIAGANGNCAYCDHSPECHQQLLATGNGDQDGNGSATATGNRNRNRNRQPQQERSDGTAAGAGTAAGQLIAGQPGAVSAGVTRAMIEEPTVPQPLHAALTVLPPWQARYVLALYELGGNEALACRRANVSHETVDEAMAASNSEFRLACQYAVRHSTLLIDAALFRGATIGDAQPVYQGGLLVGYKRVRSTKDAELLLRLRGRIGNTEEKTGPAAGYAQPVAAAAVAPIVAETIRLLMEARQQQPRLVSGSDRDA